MKNLTAIIAKSVSLILVSFLGTAGFLFALVLNSETVIDTPGPATATAHNNARKMVQDTGSNSYAIYVKDLGGAIGQQIYVSNRPNGSANWGNPTRVSMEPNADGISHEYPALAIDGLDGLHALYKVNDRLWYTSSTDGINWSAPEKLPTISALELDMDKGAIEVDNFGAVNIAYSMRESIGGPFQIFYTDYHGASWTTPIKISDYFGMDTQDQLNPSISIGTSDDVYVVWQGIGNGYSTTQIWISQINVFNTSIHPITHVSYGGMEHLNNTNPTMAITDNAEYTDIGWQVDGPSPGIYSNTLSQATGWLGSKSISINLPAGWTDRFPSIAGDYNQNSHLIWVRSHPIEEDKVYHSEFLIAADDWSTPTELGVANGDYYNFRQSRFFNNGGTMNGVWSKKTGGSHFDIFTFDTNIGAQGDVNTNLPPVAGFDNHTTWQNISIAMDVLANDTGPEVDDVLSIDSVTNDSPFGQFSLAGGYVLFTPNTDFSGGPAQAFYVVSDDNRNSTSGSISVTVNAGSPPGNVTDAIDDFLSTPVNTPISISVLINDVVDPNNLPVEIISFTQGDNGGVIVDQGSGVLQYTPSSPIYTGSETFTYSIRDNTGLVDTANVTVTVGNGPDTEVPVVSILNPTQGATVSGSQVNIIPDISDDGIISEVRYIINTVPPTAPTTITQNGLGPYVHPWNTLPLTNGDFDITVEAEDGTGKVGSNTIRVTVDNPISNIAPIISLSPTIYNITLPINSVNIDGSVTDPDNLPSGILNTSWSQIDGPNTASFSPNNNIDTNIGNLIEGTYVFEVIATDTDLSDSKVIVVNVDPEPVVQNTAPTITLTPIVYEVSLPTNIIDVDGTVEDLDNLPSGILQTTWMQKSGPNTATFTPGDNIDTQIGNLIEGTYVFEVTATDTDLSTSKTIAVTVHAEPVVGNTPPTITLPSPSIQVTLPTNTVDIDGDAVDTDGLPSGIVNTIWSQIDGPNTASFSPADNIDTQIGNLIEGTYVFDVTSNDTDLSSSKTLVVTVNPEPVVQNTAPTITLIPTVYEITLPINSVTLDGDATDTDNLPSGILNTSWVQTSGPNTATFTPNDNIDTTIGNLIEGTYVFEVTASDTDLSDTETVVVTVNPEPVTPNTAPTITLNPTVYDITLPINFVTIDGDATDTDNLPSGILNTSWNQTSGPNTATFTPNNNIDTTIGNLIEGSYVFEVTASDTDLSDSKTVVVTVNPEPVVQNTAPTITLIPTVYEITLPINSVTLDGDATDTDNLPSGILNTSWIQTSGPNTATFTPNNNIDTTIGNLIEGSYVFEVTASDTDLSDTETVVVTVNPEPVVQNTAPTITLIPTVYDITLPINFVTIDGDATDTDNLPSGILNTSWVQTSGPNTATFSPNDNIDTTIGNLIEGSYVFEVTASDTDLSDTETVVVTVNPEPVVQNTAPTITLIPTVYDITLPINSLTLDGDATDTDNLPSGILNTSWVQTSGPNTATFTPNDNIDTTIGNLIEGSYVFEVTTSDTDLSDSKTVVVTVNPESIAQNTPPTITLNPIVYEVTLPTNFIDIDGTVTDTDNLPSGILNTSWVQTSGPNTATFTPSDNIDTQIGNLVEGTYVFEVTTSDTDLSTSKTIAVTVHAEPVVGNTPPTITLPSPSIQITLPTNTIDIDGDAVDTDGLPSGVVNTIWSQVDGPNTASFSPADNIDTQIGNLIEGTYVFDVISDDTDLSSSKTLVVTVNPEPVVQNTAPTITLNPTVYEITLPINSITLDGDATDTDNLPSGILNISWVQTSGPNTATFTPNDNIDTTIGNLIEGSYVFEVTASDTDLFDTETVVVTVNPEPVVQNTAPTITLIPTVYDITLPINFVTIDGDATDTDNLPSGIINTSWVQTSGPNSATLTPNDNIDTTIGNLIEGSYVFEVTASDTDLSDSKTVVVTVNPEPVVQNTAPTITLIPTVYEITLPINSLTLDGDATDTDNLPSGILNTSWIQTSGPNTATFTPNDNIDTTIGNLIEGTYVFDVTASDTDLFDIETVVVTVNPEPAVQNSAPTITLSPTVYEITLPINSITLDGDATDTDNLPSGILNTSWIQTSGPNIANFSDNTNIDTTINNLIEGTYVFEVTASDTDLSDSKTVVVTVNPEPAVQNTAPTITLIPTVYEITLPINSVTLDGDATDTDNLPSGILNTSWVQTSGPNTATFTPNDNIDTTIGNLIEGSYVFEVTASDTDLSDSKTVVVTVNPELVVQNTAPTITLAPTVYELTLPTNFIDVDGTVEDLDNLPSGILNTSWIQNSGPNTATITPSDNIDTQIGNLVEGTYVFEVTATDTDLSDTKTIAITVHPVPTVGNTPPTITLPSPSIQITLPTNTIDIDGDAVDTDGLPSGIVNTIWSQIDGPNTASFSPADNIDTQIGNLIEGTYVFDVTSDDTDLSSSKTLVVTVNPEPVVQNTAPTITLIPTVYEITLPINSVTLDGDAIDTDNLPSGILNTLWIQTSGPNTATFTPEYNIDTTIGNLIEGTYVFEVTASDTDLSNSETIIVTVIPETNTEPTLSIDDVSATTIQLPDNTVSILGSATDDNLPAPANLQISWSMKSGPVTPSFSASDSVTTDITFVQAGTYVLEVKADDGELENTGVVVITVLPPNTAPNINLPINNQSISVGGSFAQIALNNHVFDDGPPNELRWTAGSSWANLNVFIDGNQTATINITDNNLIGSGQITFTVTDKNGTGLNDSTIVDFSIVPLAATPLVNAGENQVLILQSQNQITFTGIIENQTNGTSYDINWRQIDGPTNPAPQIQSVSQLETDIIFQQEGFYEFELTVQDGPQIGRDTISIAVVSENVDGRLTVLNPIQGQNVIGNVNVDVEINSLIDAVSLYFLPPHSSPQRLDNIGSDALQHTFIWNTDAVPAHEATTNFNVVAVFTDGTFSFETIAVHIDNEPPQIIITTPGDGTTISGFTTIKTQVSDNRVLIDRVEFYVDGELAQTVSETPFNFFWNVDDLARLTPYTITAKAFDLVGNENIDEISLIVENAPPSLGSITEFPQDNSFVDFSAPVEIFARINGATPSREDDIQNSLQVFCTKDGETTRLIGHVAIRNTNEIHFAGSVPDNCHVEWNLLIKDTNDGILQGTYKFIRPMSRERGGRIVSADGYLTVDVPANALKKDLFVTIHQLPAAAAPAPTTQGTGIEVIGSPYDIIATDENGDRFKDLDKLAILTYIQVTPPQAGDESRITQIHIVGDDGVSRPVDGIENPNISAQNITSQATVSELGTFQIVSFIGLADGLTNFYNFPNPFSPSEGTQLHYLLSKNSKVTVIIYDLFGNLVRKLEFAEGQPNGGSSGQNTPSWDGRNGEGHPVANGVYLLRVFAEDVDGLKTKVKHKALVVK